MYSPCSYPTPFQFCLSSSGDTDQKLPRSECKIDFLMKTQSHGGIILNMFLKPFPWVLHPQHWLVFCWYRYATTPSMLVVFCYLPCSYLLLSNCVVCKLCQQWSYDWNPHISFKCLERLPYFFGHCVGSFSRNETEKWGMSIFLKNCFRGEDKFLWVFCSSWWPCSHSKKDVPTVLDLNEM